MALSAIPEPWLLRLPLVDRVAVRLHEQELLDLQLVSRFHLPALIEAFVICRYNLDVLKAAISHATMLTHSVPERHVIDRTLMEVARRYTSWWALNV